MKNPELQRRALPSPSRRIRFGNFLLQLRGKEGSLAVERETALRKLAMLRNPILVQIGAHDGNEDDPLQNFIKGNEHVRAILIEPQTVPFAALKKMYSNRQNVHCVQKAVSDDTDSLTLWSAASTGKWGEEIASSNPDHIKRVLLKHPLQKLQGYTLRQEVVDAAPLHSILEAVGVTPTEVNGLFCDIEGADGKAIGSALDAGLEPSVLQYEHLYTPREDALNVNNRLIAHGYDLTFSYQDTLATK